MRKIEYRKANGRSNIGEKGIIPDTLNYPRQRPHLVAVLPVFRVILIEHVYGVGNTNDDDERRDERR